MGPLLVVFGLDCRVLCYWWCLRFHAGARELCRWCLRFRLGLGVGRLGETGGAFVGCVGGLVVTGGAFVGGFWARWPCFVLSVVSAVSCGRARVLVVVPVVSCGAERALSVVLVVSIGSVDAAAVASPVSCAAERVLAVAPVVSRHHARWRSSHRAMPQRHT